MIDEAMRRKTMFTKMLIPLDGTVGIMSRKTTSSHSPYRHRGDSHFLKSI